MKKIQFSRDCIYNFRRYKAGEKPDQWFFDAQAEIIVANGDGVVTDDMKPPKPTTPPEAPTPAAEEHHEDD